MGSHSSFGIAKSYHSYLRLVFNNIIADDTGIERSLAIQLAVKATNDVSGPAWLFPALLVFKVLPRITLVPKYLKVVFN